MKLIAILLLGASVLLPLQAQKVLVDNDFSKPDPVKWQKPVTYANFSSIEYTQERGAILKRNPKQKPIKGKTFDTAFRFESKPQALPANAEVWSVVVTLFASHKTMAALRGTGGYSCQIVWYGKDGKPMAGCNTGYTAAMKAGKLLTTETRGRVPAGAAQAAVMFGFDNPDLGPNEYMVLRRLTLTVGSKKEMDKIAPKSNADHFVALKSVSPTEDAKAPVLFSVRNFQFIDWKKAAFLLNGKDVAKNIIRKDGEFTLKPSPAFDKGLNILTIRIPAQEGTRDLELVFYIGKVTTPHKMTLRDDGMAMLDGKPFFPLGIACLVKQERNGNSYDRAFKEISEAGMDLCRHWSSFNLSNKDAKEYLACAKKYNVFVNFAPTGVKNDVKPSRIAKGVLAQRDLERVLVWEIGDDTSGWMQADELAAKQQAIKAVDPFRLTTQGDSMGTGAVPAGPSGRSSYTDYAKYSDNFQPEIYPISGRKEYYATGVPKVIQDMKDVQYDLQKNGGINRNIWPLIQYFTYTYELGSSGWSRMPTEAEIRCMSFLAIIHGAHGIIWYRYAGYRKHARRGYTDEEWKYLATLSKQLRSIIGVLEARKGKQTQSVTVLDGPAKDARKYDSVNTLLKEYNGKKYLFVANSAYAKVIASFAVPEMKTAKDLFGGKAAEVKDGKFTKELAPFDAVVFEIQ